MNSAEIKRILREVEQRRFQVDPVAAILQLGHALLEDDGIPDGMIVTDGPVSCERLRSSVEDEQPSSLFGESSSDFGPGDWHLLHKVFLRSHDPRRADHRRVLNLLAKKLPPWAR